MCDELEIFEFLENEYRLETRNRRRVLRDFIYPFDLEEREFMKKYRLSKELVGKLCDDLQPLMKINPQKSTDLGLESKVLTAIHIYSHGSYQKAAASDQHIAQQTVSAVLAEVTAALNNPIMRNKYINFPITAHERNVNKLRFFEKFGIPGVIGCIDGTHVAIVRPNEHEDRYFCRKHYHSLNVQLICNADMQITSVDASNPGASHDSFIWQNHPLRSHLQALRTSESFWLLEDSGYPLRNIMMTPILNTSANSPEEYYNSKHIQARNTIERTIGLLKARFRCLLVHRVLHYQPIVAGAMVNACVILHNICNSANLPVDELSAEELEQETMMQPTSSLSTESVVGQNTDFQMGVATLHGGILLRACGRCAVQSKKYNFNYLTV